MVNPRISRVFGAVNIGSFRVSAMIMGQAETGEMIVLGSGHRASRGIKRGYVTDIGAATYAIRDAVERAEKNAGTSISSVWIACAGAGLCGTVNKVEIEIGGRRIEEEDIEHLLIAARETIHPDGRMVLHAQPAHYTLDGAHGVANPKGLHAEALGVDIHIVLAEGAPVKNLIEAVQNAHLDVESVVAAPLATGHACLTAEERDLGVALVEIGGQVTNVSVHAGGMLLGLRTIQFGSDDITDAIASALGIRRFQAERLKCVSGSAVTSVTDHRELVPVNGPGDEGKGPMARGADDKNRIPRSELVAIISAQMSQFTDELNRTLKAMGFSNQRGGQIVLTGGGAELTGIADFAQSALGCSVRVGKPPALRGLPEAHATPGFATLAGLCLYASDDPVDIRSIGPSYQPTHRYSGTELVQRVWRAVKDYF